MGKEHVDGEVAMFKFMTKLTAIAAGAILALILLFWNTYIIDEGERAVVTRLGEVHEVWDPGFHLKMPLIDSVKRYNMRIQKTVFGKTVSEETNRENLQAYSNDNQIIESYRLSITWAHDPARLEETYRLFGDDKGDNSVFYTVVYPTVQQLSKVVFGQFVSTTIVQQRTKLDGILDQMLKDALAKYPIRILSVQIENVDFSRTFEQMIEATAQKKQEIEKAKNELKMIEISAQQKVAQADAENKAIKLQADAKAYRISVEAKAEAEAIRVKAEALKANKELIELTIAEKWDGKLPTTNLSGNSVPLLNLNK